MSYIFLLCIVQYQNNITETWDYLNNGDDLGDIRTKEQELEDERLSAEAAKIGSLFQIMFNNIHIGYQRYSSSYNGRCWNLWKVQES